MFIDLGDLVPSKGDLIAPGQKIKQGVLKSNVYSNKIFLLEKVNEISSYREEISFQEIFKKSLGLITVGSKNLFPENELVTVFSKIYDQYKYSTDVDKKEKIKRYATVDSLGSFYEIEKELLGVEFGSFIIELKQKLEEIVIGEGFDTEDKFKIVVAGQFSAGKSTFINSLLDEDVLPTDIKPTSSIATYLNFNNKINNFSASCVNHRGILVPIEKELLEHLKHGTDANEILAGVIHKIVLNIPSKYTKNFVLIDTPGHNSSNLKNTFNNKRDYDVSFDETKNCNAIFYLIDIAHGTLKSSDIEFLNYTKSDVYVIFTKADNMLIENVKKVVDQSIDAILNNVRDSKRVKNVFAYDSSCKKIIYLPIKYNISKWDFTINRFFNDLLSKYDYNDFNCNFIDDIFDKMTVYCESKVRECEKEYAKNLKEEFDFNGLFDLIYSPSFDERIKKICIRDYERIKKTSDKIKFRKSYFNEVLKIIRKINNMLVFEFERELKAFKTNKNTGCKTKSKLFSNKSIFQAIEDNDLDSFYKIFADKGVKLSDRNSQHFSPMTYAVKHGNIEMVKYFLSFNIDISLLDKRGKNMFHTAIEFGFINIINELIKYDSSVVYLLTSNNEDYVDILSKMNYYNLIDYCIRRYES